jgi:hypothetical protein
MGGMTVLFVAGLELAGAAADGMVEFRYGKSALGPAETLASAVPTGKPDIVDVCNCDEVNVGKEERVGMLAVRRGFSLGCPISPNSLLNMPVVCGFTPLSVGRLNIVELAVLIVSTLTV